MSSDGPVPEVWAAARFNKVAIPASLLVHVAIMSLVALATIGRPLLVLVPPRSIDVEIITELEYKDEFELPPKAATAPLVTPELTEEPDGAQAAPDDGMKHATELFANALLTDPENQQVRDTLPLLEGSERILQLCVLEGLEQLRQETPEPIPDSIAPSAFGATTLRGFTVEALDAAYRASRKWYRLAFNCTVAPDLAGVEAYAFKVGEAIAESEWEAHDLIAEDEDE